MWFWLSNLPYHWLWVILVVIFSLIEIFTLALTTVWFAIGALLMVFLSFFIDSFRIQALIFLLISAALLIFTRPVAIKKFRMGKEKTNVDSLAGKTALVVKKITEFERGEARVSGAIWSARSEDGLEIAEGKKCEIIRVEGVQLIVREINS